MLHFDVECGFLEKAEKLELISLDPATKGQKIPEEKTFYGWEVLGSTVIADEETRKNLVVALKNSHLASKADEEARKKFIAALKNSPLENEGGAWGCFVPRHGLRATLDNKAWDLVICFECEQVEVHLDEKKVRHFLITSSGLATFNAALKAAKVALPKQAAIAK